MLKHNLQAFPRVEEPHGPQPDRTPASRPARGPPRRLGSSPAGEPGHGPGLLADERPELRAVHGRGGPGGAGRALLRGRGDGRLLGRRRAILRLAEARRRRSANGRRPRHRRLGQTIQALARADRLRGRFRVCCPGPQRGRSDRSLRRLVGLAQIASSPRHLARRHGAIEPTARGEDRSRDRTAANCPSRCRFGTETVHGLRCAGRDRGRVGGRGLYGMSCARQPASRRAARERLPAGLQRSQCPSGLAADCLDRPPPASPW